LLAGDLKKVATIEQAIEYAMREKTE